MSANISTSGAGGIARSGETPVDGIVRSFAGAMVLTAGLFLINAVLIFWWDWPGSFALYSHLGLPGFEPLPDPLSGSQLAFGWVQAFSYIGGIIALLYYVFRSGRGSLERDSALYSNLAALIVRAAFWSAALIGIADAVISFVRVEGFMPGLIGDSLTTKLGLSRFRGLYVHYPLMALGFVIACFTRSLSFIWLALMVVFAEFQIVISRFVFSYEQAFMGDLVRFWYAGLFLIASAHNLIDEGHVRVDVLYAHFSERGKAWANALGCTLLGLPLCWIILSMGMWSRGSSLNSPMLSFEISQSAYGLYVKYLMAGFLVVFAVSMIFQFSSYLLSNVAIIRNRSTPQRVPAGDASL